MESRGTIVGFTNPLRLKCALLVTIVQVDNDQFSVFPDGTTYRLDPTSKNVKSLDSFQPHTENRILKVGEISYLSLYGEIFIGTKEVINSAIVQDFYSTNSVEYRRILGSYIEMEKSISKFNNEESLPVNELRIFASLRKISNGKWGRRFFIQRWTNGGYKTHFKKNVNGLETVEELDRMGLKDRIMHNLRSLSHFYTQLEFDSLLKNSSLHVR